MKNIKKTQFGFLEMKKTSISEINKYIYLIGLWWFRHYEKRLVNLKTLQWTLFKMKQRN